MSDKAAVPDTNILLYWTIPSDLFPKELEERYEAVKEYMDEKVKEWDVYISPTVRKEFGKGVVTERVLNDTNEPRMSYEWIEDFVLKRVRDKIDAISDRVYLLDNCEELVDKIVRESELFDHYRQACSQLSKDEKNEFRHKSLLPGLHDIEYLAEGLQTRPKSSFFQEDFIYDRLAYISEDKHISHSRFIDLLTDLGLEVVTVDEILQSDTAKKETQQERQLSWENLLKAGREPV